MKCVIQGANIKIFAKAIHSLGKIGSELFIEPYENTLSLRSINYNKSAFASYSFNRSFFSEYSVETIESELSNYYDGKCRISLKACLAIFKNMKEVEICKIITDFEKLLVELHCHLNTKKNYVISIVDVETLQSAHTFPDNVSRVSASHKIFGDISNNFQMAEEEITLEFDFDSLIVKNYVEGSAVDPKFMRSQLTLQPDEFTTYSVKEKVSITFCLREFRALLNFVENVNLDLILKFSEAGKPALFSSETIDEFEANVLLSTLSPDDVFFLNNSNLSIAPRSQTQQHITSCGLDKNTNMSRNETLNFKEGIPLENEFNSSGTSVTFEDSEKNTRDVIPSSSNGTCKKTARTVFTRCFVASEDTTLNRVCHSTILAESSDNEI